MDSNPVRHPSPAKKIKYSFLDYVQLLMIGWAGRWTRTPSTTPLQPKKWNACFWITFNFWWSAGLVDGLKPHLPPLSSQKNKMPIFGLHSNSHDWPRWSMDSTSSATPLQPKKLNASFWITFNFWWSAMLVNGLKPRPPPLSSQKMKCSFLDYVQLRWLTTLVNGLEPCLSPLSSQKNKMLIFRLCSTSDDQPAWSMDSNSICHPSPAKKIKCFLLDYIQLLMIDWAGQWTQTPSTTPL